MLKKFIKGNEECILYSSFFMSKAYLLREKTINFAMMIFVLYVDEYELTE